jgi:hypothetical protein
MFYCMKAKAQLANNYTYHVNTQTRSSYTYHAIPSPIHFDNTAFLALYTIFSFPRSATTN